jgi:hypothetical protein
MRRTAVVSVLMAALLAGCGGGEDKAACPEPHSRQGAVGASAPMKVTISHDGSLATRTGFVDFAHEWWRPQTTDWLMPASVRPNRAKVLVSGAFVRRSQSEAEFRTATTVVAFVRTGMGCQ